jgi:hypothetical protein
MRRKYLIGLVLCLLFGSMALSVQNSFAWKNGWGDNSPHSTYAKTVSLYKGDYSNSHKLRTTSKYYGTHDWIAERALYLAYTSFPESMFLTMLYLDVSQLKMYYLLGTEFPDSVKGNDVYGYGETLISTGLNVISRQDFEGCFGEHQLRFVSGNPDPYVKNLAKFAENMQNKVADYLEQEDCKAAAFFLGALAHYVADAACMPHLIDDFKAYHGSWEHWVHTLTTRKIVDEYYSDGEFTTENPFYQWRGEGSTAESMFLEKKPNLAARLATREAGYTVFQGKMEGWGLDVGASYYEDHPQFPYPYFDLEKPEKRENYWENLNGDDLDFLFGVNLHLNIGIYYMAAVLNHVKDWFVKCSGDIEDELTAVIVDMAIESTLLWLFIIIGNAATILALVSSLTEKENILESVQIF